MTLRTSADQMFYTTLFIAAFFEGSPVGTGTAFFFSFRSSAGQVPLLITNKHVIAGADEIEVSFHAADSAGTPMGTFPCKLALDGVIPHPEPDVDLCAIPIGHATHMAEKAGKPVYAICLTEENIPTPADWDALDSIEPVFMVGCPRGIYDTTNNVPIVRSGITASNPRLRYAGKDEFMVDMACFPGSSGSPVFQAPSVSRLNRSTGGYEIGGPSRGLLLGILYSGPIIDNKGNLVFSSSPSITVSTMMHLGNAIRSNRILDLKVIVNTHLARQGLPLLS